VTKDLKQRLLVALIGIPVMLFVFYESGVYLLALLGIVSILGMFEYNQILKKASLFQSLPDVIICFFIYLFVAIPDKLFLDYNNLVVLMLMILLLRTLYWLLFKSPSGNLKDYLLTIIGWLYLGLFPGLIYKLGFEYNAQKLLLLLIIMIWITDSAAYFIGMRFGKHKGIFAVSPNKSMEGFIAGLLAPVVVCSLLFLVQTYWSLPQLALVALSAGLIGQIGDLFESKIKRTGGVKDSSKIFPGHGGVLDRFDSLLIAGPVLYILLILIP